MEKREKKNKTKKKEGTAVSKKKAVTGVHRRNIVCMAFLVTTMAFVSSVGSYVTGADIYNMVRNITLCMAAALATVFSFQAGRLSGSFLYDDGEYPNRFLMVWLCGILCALVFRFLPVTGWMFLFFFVALARVSDGVSGMCGGMALLVLTTVLCEQVSLSIFLVYLLSGMVGIALFAHQRGEFYTAVPLGLSLGSQLVLIFAGELVIQNRKLVLEDALVTLANTAMNGILICIFLQYYINKVAKKTDNQYLRLNDPEYEVMRRVREQRSDDYYCAIHTAYLVERITSELGLDVRSAKCAAYYGHLKDEELKAASFPEPVAAILAELREKKSVVRKKETVIVGICHTVIREIQRLNRENPDKKIDYRKLIHLLFERQFTIEALAETEITLSNLRYLEKRLSEEQMYYEVFMKRDTVSTVKRVVMPRGEKEKKEKEENA